MIISGVAKDIFTAVAIAALSAIFSKVVEHVDEKFRARRKKEEEPSVIITTGQVDR